MTKGETVDFNLFVGAETGILKGVNVHKDGNIVKNFHNLKSLEKEFEITCASFGEGDGEILMGLRNQTVKVYDVAFRSFSQSVSVAGGSGPVVGVARHDGALVTAVQGGTVSYWRYPDPTVFDPIDDVVGRMGKLRRKEDDLDEGEKEERAKHRWVLTLILTLMLTADGPECACGRADGWTGCGRVLTAGPGWRSAAGRSTCRFARRICEACKLYL
jgi:hypothetical protein